MDTHSLIAKDRALIWHPFTQAKTAAPPIPIARGKGLYLYTPDGTRYMDAISSWWVNLHGHAHPYIAECIQSQAALLEHTIFADFTHAPAIHLAERLLPLLPGSMAKIFYSDNGSTAVEVAIKMALQYWYRKNDRTIKKKILAFNHSYHGDTFGAMSCAGKNRLNQPFWHHLFEVVSIDPPMKGEEERSLIQLQQALDQEDIACFLFEPLVLGAGGMILYSAEGLNAILRCCRQHDLLLIADEVMTGFGRLDTLFACEHLKETPDIICLSKGITGGFLPLGATACTEKIFNAFLGDHLSQAFLHGHSYTGNPIACQSALASLDLLLHHSCFSKRAQIALSHQAFCRKWHGHPKLKRCESLGTLLIVEYHSKHPSYFHSIREQLIPFFLKHHILLRPLGNVLYVLPPYCIQEEELAIIYDTIILTLTMELYHSN